MAGDRKKIEERLQAIEKDYQKTLQEKIQLEKDLYDANHQLLSYKVMYSLYIWDNQFCNITQQNTYNLASRLHCYYRAIMLIIKISVNQQH